MMIRNKSHTPSLKRLTPRSRSISFTLIAGAAAIGLVVMIGPGVLSGCANDRGENHDVNGESQTERDVNGESQMEHASAENSEAASDDREESGDALALDETYDFVRKGARLILRYDPASNSFVGTVQNTTESTLYKVRVEVHLSNGTELGPTTPADLSPGASAEVSLAATEEPFTGWTPHAEVGQGEHGEGSEGGEHGSGGEGGEGEPGEGGNGGGEHGSGGEGGEGGHGQGREGGGEHGGGGESGGEHGDGGESGGEQDGSGEGGEGSGEHSGGEVGGEGSGEHGGSGEGGGSA